MPCVNLHGTTVDGLTDVHLSLLKSTALFRISTKSSSELIVLYLMHISTLDDSLLCGLVDL